jgi:hypothetical protein
VLEVAANILADRYLHSRPGQDGDHDLLLDRRSINRVLDQPGEHEPALAVADKGNAASVVVVGEVVVPGVLDVVIVP